MKKAKYPRISGQTNRAALFRQGVFVLIKTGVIVVVKKRFRYSNVFFYNHLCRNTVIRNIIMESGIILVCNPFKRYDIN